MLAALTSLRDEIKGRAWRRGGDACLLTIAVAKRRVVEALFVRGHLLASAAAGQAARASSNTAILMVAKLEKVSDTAYGSTIRSPWRSAPQV